MPRAKPQGAIDKRDEENSVVYLAKASPKSTPMGCYFGTRRDGEIIDHGRAVGVESFVLRGDKLVKLGIFASRKLAIAAVSEAAATK
jgi:hypothetical protein